MGVPYGQTALLSTLWCYQLYSLLVVPFIDFGVVLGIVTSSGQVGIRLLFAISDDPCISCVVIMSILSFPVLSMGFTSFLLFRQLSSIVVASISLLFPLTARSSLSFVARFSFLLLDMAHTPCLMNH